MDIRIGNDIRLNVAISDFNILEEETIKCAHCFLMNAAEKSLSYVDPKSITLPSKYTLRTSGSRIYNVLPINVQVRPCGGPGLFGKSLRQYGKPIFTRVSEDDGYIYGYFQEIEQLMLGDYHLVVMLVLDREKYGISNKRHIVIDYGYVFTLTMDGDVCDPNGIYVSLANKKLDAQFVEPDILLVSGEPVSYINRRLNINIKDDAAKVFDSDLIFTIK